MIIVNGWTITNKIPTEKHAAEIENWVKSVYFHEKFQVDIRLTDEGLVIFVENKERPYFHKRFRMDGSVLFYRNQASDFEVIVNTLTYKILSIIGEIEE